MIRPVRPWLVEWVRRLGGSRLQHRAEELGPDGLERLDRFREVSALGLPGPDDEEGSHRGRCPSQSTSRTCRRRSVHDHDVRVRRELGHDRLRVSDAQPAQRQPAGRRAAAPADARSEKRSNVIPAASTGPDRLKNEAPLSRPSICRYRVIPPPSKSATATRCPSEANERPRSTATFALPYPPSAPTTRRLRGKSESAASASLATRRRYGASCPARMACAGKNAPGAPAGVQCAEYRQATGRHQILLGVDPRRTSFRQEGERNPCEQSCEGAELEQQGGTGSDASRRRGGIDDFDPRLRVLQDTGRGGVRLGGRVLSQSRGDRVRQSDGFPRSRGIDLDGDDSGVLIGLAADVVAQLGQREIRLRATQRICEHGRALHELGVGGGKPLRVTDQNLGACLVGGRDVRAERVRQERPSDRGEQDDQPPSPEEQTEPDMADCPRLLQSTPVPSPRPAGRAAERPSRPCASSRASSRPKRGRICPHPQCRVRTQACQ